jgi:hypothetical protein
MDLNDTYVICPACTHITYDIVLFFIDAVPATEVSALTVSRYYKYVRQNCNVPSVS